MSDSSDKFQLPDTNILFHEIGKNNKFFSTLDIRSGYWQFSIKKEGIKLVFSLIIKLIASNVYLWVLKIVVIFFVGL